MVCRQLAQILAVLLFWGCADSEPTVARAALDAPAVSHGAPATAEVERQTKKLAAPRVPMGPIARDVDWEAARKTPRLEFEIAAAEAAKLEDVRVPVLLPVVEPPFLRSLVITHHRDWYAASMNHDRVNLHLRGNRNEYVVPGLEEVHLPEYLLTRTHGIVSVSWRAFGVAYNLDVECFAALEDRRCTEDDFALGLAQSVRLAGGRP